MSSWFFSLTWEYQEKIQYVRSNITPRHHLIFLEYNYGIYTERLFNYLTISLQSHYEIEPFYLHLDKISSFNICSSEKKTFFERNGLHHVRVQHFHCRRKFLYKCRFFSPTHCSVLYLLFCDVRICAIVPVHESASFTKENRYK